MTDERWNVRTALLAALVISSALAPPELSPTGSALAVTLGTGLGVLLLFGDGRARAWTPEENATALVVSAYFGLSVLLSSQPHRSLSCLLGPGMGLVACLAARREATHPGNRDRILKAFVMAGSLVASYGLYQKWLGLPAAARDLRLSHLPERDAYVIRAESGRAFGPFLLPSSLGLYLGLAIPLTVLLLLRRRPGERMRLLVWALLLVQIAGVWATLSYGSVGAFLGAVLLLPAFGRRRPQRVLLTAGAAGGILLALFVTVRLKEGVSPLMLRWNNWLAAVRVFAESPLFGVGFGNFVDSYPQQMRPGMNESSHVHNSYLQVAAEGGVLALVWVAWGLTRFAAAARSRLREAPDRLAAVLPVLPPLVFLLHNLVDFSAYQPSLTIAFGATLGLAFPGIARDTASDPEPRRGSLPQNLALLLLLLGGATWGLREAWARGLIETGLAHLDSGEFDSGIAVLSQAARWDPHDPDPPSVLSEVYLSEPRRGPRWSARGEAWARKAVALRPRRAYGHYVLALFRLRAADPGEAWVELSRARLLFPLRELYAREEAELRGMISAVHQRGGDADR